MSPTLIDVTIYELLAKAYSECFCAELKLYYSSLFAVTDREVTTY